MASISSASLGPMAQQVRVGTPRNSVRPESVTPCTVRPADTLVSKFVIGLLGRIEQRGVDQDMLPYFTQRFASEKPILVRRSELADALKGFGIDRYDRPLDQRIIKPPTAHAVAPPYTGEWHVAMTVMTARGAMLQGVYVVCEAQRWRVMRVEYAPAG